MLAGVNTHLGARTLYRFVDDHLWEPVRGRCPRGISPGEEWSVILFRIHNLIQMGKE